MQQPKKFVIQGRLWALNDYVNACKSQYGKHTASAYKKNIEQFIGWSIKLGLGNWHTDKGVYLKFRWIEPNKKRDKDNIAFGKKFIQDALVNAGVIHNDGWKHIIGFEDSFGVDSDNPRVEVEIIEVD